ncbi:TonB-dependent receptor plug domain-containing protein [Flammeovirga aprica]|uniref:TonB-dependent receptor n=1 Tax=Flammeovirga aprica JL-4 TaxID=694437 RepID=A0A7X9XCX1_9BACT|nr:TonB-dependent receptor [Flammeovirga aprica]NME72281.1 TonB-dependent receptor [Flammeovirga aprica JL-4]
MKKHYSNLVAFLLFFTIGTLGFAQEKMEQDSSKISSYYLEEVAVSSGRVPQLYSEQARIITYIGAEDIQKMPAQSFDQILKYVASVDLKSRGPLDIQGDVIIRGGTFDQSLVLLNGVNMNNPQTGHHNLFLPVDMEAVNAIEVLEGPASRVFGANAFTGAVNVQTKPMDKNNIYAHAMFGDFNLQKYVGRVNLTSGKTRHMINASYNKSDGYTKNTAFERANAYYHGAYDVKGGTFDLTAGIVDKDFDANAFYGDSDTQHERVRLMHGSLRYTNNGKIKVSPMVYWNRTYDHYQWWKDNPVADNHHKVDVAGFNLNTIIPWKLGKTSIGADVKYEGILSTSLGKDINPIEVPYDNSVTYKKGDERFNYSLFLEHNIILGKFTASAGIMLNYNTQIAADSSSNGFNVFPGIDMSYELSNSLRVFTTLNTSMRLPTYTDLYYAGRNNIGNPNLKEERATTLELGLKYEKNGVNASVSAFRRWGTNIIDWVQVDTTAEGKSIFQPQNYNELTMNGITFNASLDFRRILHPEAFLHSIQFSAAYLAADQNANDLGTNSRYVLDYLNSKETLGITHSLFVKGLSANWQLTHQNRNGGYNDFEKGEVDYKPFFVMDAKVNYNIKRFNIYVEASNLFDVEYHDIGNIPMPGRWARAGVKMDLDF